MSTTPAARLVKVTPTAVATFGDCPRAYRHKYIDRAPQRGGPWAHLDAGNATHLALAAYWDLPLEKQVHPAAARHLVAQHWQDRAFRDPEHAAAWKAQVTRWVADYFDGLAATPRPIGIERTVATVEQGMALEGRADRIDHRGDRLVVVDYKTGKRPPTDADAACSPALALYALAATRQFWRAHKVPCDRAELHHLPSGTVAVVDYDKARIMRHIDRIRQQAHDISRARSALDDIRAGGGDDADVALVADEAFPARPGPLCGSCSFRDRCPEGTAAAPAAQPWDYLPELGEPSRGYALTVIVTGSRDWDDPTAIEAHLREIHDRYGSDVLVRHGAARGADTIAARIATELGMTVKPYRADWDRYGGLTTGKNPAGMIRNKQMVDAGADVVLGYPQPQGTGTQRCMAMAERAGIRTVMPGRPVFPDGAAVPD